MFFFLKIVFKTLILCTSVTVLFLLFYKDSVTYNIKKWGFFNHDHVNNIFCNKNVVTKVIADIKDIRIVCYRILILKSISIKFFYRLQYIVLLTKSPASRIRIPTET